MSQVQFVLRQMPSFRLPTRHAVTQAAFAMSQGLFNLPTRKLNYRFTENDLVTSRGSDAQTNDILESISRNQTGLKLSTTYASYSDEFGSPQKHQIYRLESAVHHARFDFDLWLEGDGLYAHALIVFVMPNFQSRFFNFRDFLINRVAKTLFDCRRKRIHFIGGRAMANQYMVRQARDWRDTLTKDKKSTKLVRLYQRCGFIQPEDDSDTVVLLSEQTRHEYAASGSPAKRLLAEQHGKLARRPTAVNSA